MLPYGYYELVVSSSSCECLRLPTVIENCSGELAGVCTSNTQVCLAPRECPTTSCSVEDIECPDPCATEKGNSMGESSGLNIDWKITKRNR